VTQQRDVWTHIRTVRSGPCRFTNKEVIIGIDPHKSSHTAVALDATGQVLGELRVTAGKHQIRELQSFAEPWPERRWAVEGANGLGRLLSQQLVAASEPVTDVPVAQPSAAPASRRRAAASHGREG
jgi:hypothetical protein